MNERGLRTAATWGALLTVAVVGASALLRLASNVDGAGGVTSALPSSIEAAVRLAHRACASAVLVLALVSGWLALHTSPRARRRVVALAAIALLTLGLAAIGRYTPGYRVPFVTALNVAFGVGLAAAFWWLRADAGPSRARNGGKPSWAGPLALVTLAMAALGAGSSAAAMHGTRSMEPWHIAGGIVLAAVLAGLTLRRATHDRFPLLPVAILQLATGYGLASGARLPVVEWTHGILAALLVLSLAGLAHRRRA